MKLTKNFTLEELISSTTATRKGIDNTPDEVVKERLKNLCEKVLQPIRDKYGKTIIVNSGYRCPKLNAAVGGAKTSDHMYGCAADIRAVDGTVASNKELFNVILNMINNGELVVKQLIDEYGYRWVHVSYQDGRTPKKNQIMHLR